MKILMPFSLDFSSAWNNRKGIPLLENIFFVTPLCLVIAMTIGTAFYMIIEQWDLLTSIFYSVNVLTGCLYTVPGEKTTASKIFTLCLFVTGTLPTIIILYFFLTMSLL